MMIKITTLLCTLLLAVSAQPPSPYFSFSSGGPPSNQFGGGGGGPPPNSYSGGPPSSSPFRSGGPPPSHFGGGGPPSSSPFGNGGPPPSYSSGGPPSFSSFNGGQPQSGRPGSRPGGPGKGPKQGNKLFSWIGNTMSKLQGLGPKITYHSTKPKQQSHGGPPHGGSAQNSPPQYFSSGGPPRGAFPDIPNSLFEDGPSPFGNGGSTVTYSSPNSVDHAPVIYRNPSGPPPSGFGPRPGPPPPSYASSRPPPSFGSRPPPSYSSGGPPQYSSSSFGSSRPPFGGPPPSSFRPSQGHRNNNLEVFPSQQISYQTQTLSQNEPGYDDVLGNPQSLYSSQSNGRPSYYQNQNGPSNYEQQQSSYSQNQPQIAKGPKNNYGASFHSIEPVKVAPVYDVNQHFQPSSSDMSGAYSNNVQQRQQQQQPSNIHDTPFESIVNDYAAQADAVTAGSEQMISAIQNGPDMATSASTNQGFSGMQIMGQGTSPDGNPMFEVVAGANAPTYDGHPVDLNKLISMIEPGAQIDTMPSYGGDSDMGASEHQHVYADPSSLETESDAAMASGIMSGNKAVVAETESQTQLNKDNSKLNFYNNINDQLHAIASESRPTVVKLDGTRLNDEKIIKEHFDKEIILDELQENKDHGFIIVGVNTDNDTGDEDEHLHDGTNKTWTMIDSYDNNSKNKNTDNDNDDLLAIVQQLRNSASSVLVDRFKNDLTSAATTPIPESDNSTTEQQISRHPNHNYYPELSPTRLTLEETKEYDNETHKNSSVINPIFDSIKTTKYDDEGYQNDNNSSLLLKSDHQDNVEDDDDDDQFLHDDDLIMTDDDEMAASASRNVKSVAIIVTPPPNYVKIKNKYKKAITPLSYLTSTTTEMPDSTIDSIETTPISSAVARSADDDDAVSESLSINSSNPGGQHNQTSNKDHQSSISTENNTTTSSLEIINPLPNSGNNKDSISNISTISSGIDASQFSNNGNGEVESRSRKTPRYPVYRGKTSA